MPRRPSQRALSVCILTTHPLVLEEFQRLLGRPSFRCTARQLDPALAIHLQRAQLPPAKVYVVDAHAPRPVTDSLLAAVAEFSPGSRVMLVAAKFGERDAFSAMRLGVRGLLTYADAREQLARAVQAVGAGGFWVPRRLLSHFVDQVLGMDRRRGAYSRPANLSKREQEIFDGLLENLANKEIASRLNISERTVKFHVSNVLAKFGVRRRADLILHCMQTHPSGP